MTRDCPPDFRRLLREYDPDADLRWNPTECVWVLWRRSRGQWFEELVLGPEDPGEWTIEYLHQRDMHRLRGGFKGYRQWLKERDAQRMQARKAANRQRIADVVHDNWRHLKPMLRDDIEMHTAFTVQGLRR